MVLRVAGMARRFGAVTAVADVSLTVAAGEVVSLLGPNGAGKTTTVDCILGLLTPDVGTITIDGLAPRDARAKFGAVLQATGLPDKITPAEALNAFSHLSFPRKRESNSLLERFGLTEKADAHYDTLSGGQKQRLALALAVIGDPKLLVLDEPTAGLDIQARRSLHDDIRAARHERRAVLLTTHDMAEARALCDRIAVMARGRIVATGTPEELGAGLEDMTAGLGADGQRVFPRTLCGGGAAVSRDGIGARVLRTSGVAADRDGGGGCGGGAVSLGQTVCTKSHLGGGGAGHVGCGWHLEQRTASSGGAAGKRHAGGGQTRRLCCAPQGPEREDLA